MPAFPDFLVLAGLTLGAGPSCSGACSANSFNAGSTLFIFLYWSHAIQYCSDTTKLPKCVCVCVPEQTLIVTHWSPNLTSMPKMCVFAVRSESASKGRPIGLVAYPMVVDKELEAASQPATSAAPPTCFWGHIVHEGALERVADYSSYGNCNGGVVFDAATGKALGELRAVVWSFRCTLML